MTSGGNYRGLPEQQLREYVWRMEQRVTQLENRSFRIPVLDSLPEDGDTCNLWAFEDGTLNFRNSDGDIFQYMPYQTVGIPTVGSDPAADTNKDMWLIAPTGQLRVRASDGTVFRYTADTPGTTTPAAPKPPAPPKPKPANPTKKRYTSTWFSAWSESYDGDGSRRTDDNHLYFGRVSSTHGRQRSLIGFDHNAIRTALTGASISKVEIYLYNLWAYNNSGVIIKFGGHNNSGRPGSYGGAVKNYVSSGHWNKPEQRWQSISTWFGRAFRDNAIKGILIDQGTDSNSAYGYAAGVNDSGYGLPKIRITYTK